MLMQFMEWSMHHMHAVSFSVTDDVDALCIEMRMRVKDALSCHIVSEKEGILATKEEDKFSRRLNVKSVFFSLNIYPFSAFINALEK